MTSDCGSEGRGFEPRRSPSIFRVGKPKTRKSKGFRHNHRKSLTPLKRRQRGLRGQSGFYAGAQDLYTVLGSPVHAVSERPDQAEHRAAHERILETLTTSGRVESGNEMPVDLLDG